MKHISLIILLLALALFLLSCSPREDIKNELNTSSEKTSYAMGLNMGGYLKNLETDIDLELLFQAIRDTLQGRKVLLTPQQAAEVMKEFQKKSQEEQIKKRQTQTESNIKEGKDFLEENKKKAGIVTTASGLQYEVLQEGDGSTPEASDQVSVNYRGTLIDGTEFDSSYKRGTPAEFRVNGVIKGWTEALQLMRAGSKYRLFIPSELAYGARGAGQKIGPNATLIFEVELLTIVK